MIQQEIDIPAHPPKRPLITLRNPLPLDQQNKNPRLTHPLYLSPEEIIHRLVPALQPIDRRDERSHILLHQLDVLDIIQSGRDQTHDRLLLSERIQLPPSQRDIQRELDFALPKTSPQ